MVQVPAVPSIERTPLWLRWLGVAGIALRQGERVLAVDPYLTRIPFWRQYVGRVTPNRPLVAATVPRCDLVAVTHAHFDHLLDVPQIAQRTGARVLGSANACALLRVLAVAEEQVQQVGVGQRIRLGSYQVEVCPAVHGPAPGFGPGPLGAELPVRPSSELALRARDYRMDCCFSFLITVDAPGERSLRLLTDPGVPMTPTEPVDVLFLAPHRGAAHYGPILRAVRPGLVIPIHWDDFWRPLSKPLRPMVTLPRWALPPLGIVGLDRFRAEVERLVPGTAVFVPEVLREYNIAEIIPGRDH